MKEPKKLLPVRLESFMNRMYTSATKSTGITSFSASMPRALKFFALSDSVHVAAAPEMQKCQISTKESGFD